MNGHTGSLLSVLVTMCARFFNSSRIDAVPQPVFQGRHYGKQKGLKRTLSMAFCGTFYVIKLQKRWLWIRGFVGWRPLHRQCWPGTRRLPSDYEIKVKVVILQIDAAKN